MYLKVDVYRAYGLSERMVRQLKYVSLGGSNETKGLTEDSW